MEYHLHIILRSIKILSIRNLHRRISVFRIPRPVILRSTVPPPPLPPQRHNRRSLLRPTSSIPADPEVQRPPSTLPQLLLLPPRPQLRNRSISERPLCRHHRRQIRRPRRQMAPHFIRPSSIIIPRLQFLLLLLITVINIRLNRPTRKVRE